MTNQEFLKKVDGARNLLNDILNQEVVIRLKGKDGFTLSEHFKLTDASYMFSPLRRNEDGTTGSMVLEIQVD